MKLGLHKDEVRIVPHDPSWKDTFFATKSDIQLHTKLPANRIEHIGSTAIEGLSAKPIIDILVGVDHLKNIDQALIKGLTKSGFLRLKVDRQAEIVFAQFTDTTYEVKTHFIHLVEFQQDLWKNLLFFRDHLRVDEHAKKQYEDLKRHYIKTSSTGINEYTHYKEAFVKSIFQKRITP